MDDRPCTMTDPDQCIICLEALPPTTVDSGTSSPPTNPANVHSHQLDSDQHGASAPHSNGIIVPVFDKSGPFKAASDGDNGQLGTSDDDAALVARLHGCDHVLHEGCIRSWAQKTNTCPICRTSFTTVSVFGGVGGPLVKTYSVEEKKQVADFDIREWLDQNDGLFDDEEEDPCPVCNRSDHEEQLLLCDNCNAAYHTYCIGLDTVPEGHWYCLECAHTMNAPPRIPDLIAEELEQEDEEDLGENEEEEEDDSVDFAREQTPSGIPPGPVVSQQLQQRQRQQQRYFPRTRSRMRHVRQHARMLDWQGPWGEITGRVFEGLDLDLDNPFGEDETMQHFRQSQRRSDRERREYERWQQRLNIASRLGARDAFSRTIPADISEHLVEPPPPRSAQEVREERSERQAWGALDRAREVPSSSSPNNGRKRVRSRTQSPGEPQEQQPERKLKRPRTRRLPAPITQGQQVNDSAASHAPTQARNSSPRRASTAGSPIVASPPADEGPTFLSSLLREVEMSTPGEDGDQRPLVVNGLGNSRYVAESMSPVGPPSPTGYSSPRAMTPPPFSHTRPSSPQLSLSSHIEPRYAPANYSPTRGNDDETRRASSPVRQNSTGSNMRSASPDGQRLARRQSVRMGDASPRMADSSPTRQSLLSIEIKANISNMVRAALRPHWHAKQLSPEQYANINRDISHKLYDAADDIANEEGRKKWERVVTQEVARAVSELQS